MKTVKPTRLSLVTRFFEEERRPRFVVGVTAAFRLGVDKELVSDIEMWPLVMAALEVEDGVLDEGAPKVRGEVLVAGHCYPPGAPQAVSFARVKVGTVDKRLAVIGDRQWKHGVPSEPRPFEKMPLDWTRAFGGEGFDDNPKGRGFVPVDGEGGRVHPLPNVEDAKALVKSPRDRPEPAGFGGLGITLPQRKSKFGTYDKQWLETRAFAFARDMDPTIFNLAPPDQWLEGFFQGDETYLVENMHPERARIEGRLPPLGVRVFVTQTERGGDEVFKEIPTRIDTLRLFPEQGIGVMIYRGVLDVWDDEADDVRELLLACEDRSAPRPTEHYHQALVRRRDHEEAGLLALSERDLVPPAELGWHTVSPASQIKDIPKPEFIRRDNFKRRHALEVEEAKARVVASGLDPKDFALDTQEEVPDVDLDDADATADFIREQRALSTKRRDEYEDKRKEIEANTRATFAAQGLDYDEEADKALKESAGPPKFNARRQIEQLESLLAIAREHGQPVVEMEQKLADPAYLAELLEAEERLRQAYVLSAHHRRPVERLAPDDVEPFRAEIEAAQHNAIGLEGRDYSGADLSGMSLPGMDLAGAFLEAVDLSRTDLSGANLERTVLAHAKLHGTKLAGARLSEANLGRAEIVDADLSGALLDKAVLEKTRFTRTSLRGVRFDKTSLIETEFVEDVDLGEASAELMAFYHLDLRGVRCRGARFTKCAFVECDLRGADLTGIDLSATTLVTCAADGARFADATLAGTQFVAGTTLAGADFSRAQLQNASLRKLDLSKARFTGAVLDRADLSKSNLREADLTGVSASQAMFIAADLTGASLAKSDFLSALFTRAKLFGTSLEGANLFQADLAKVQTDGATNLERANLGRARVHPRYQPPPETKD